MMHQRSFIILCTLLCISASLASDAEKSEVTKKSTHSTSTEVSVKVSSSEANSADSPFETSHKIQKSVEFQTSHSISKEAFKQRRDDLHQSMRSKEKPELNEKLGELIAADIKNNIEAKRLSEYERYDVEPLTTTEKPVLTTQAMVAKSINEGLIDDFSILEEAGSENKQTSRIQIKKGPNGQDYEYEYVYYYYDDEEGKTAGDDDVIIGSRKGQSSTTTTTQAPSGKSRYSNIERGSSTSAPERNEIQSRGKARAQALPAPVVEEVVEERLPQVTRFPQRAKSANPSENAPETGKKQHVKRPSLELVDSHSFVTDEKDLKSKGPRIIETELSKSELIETVSKSSIEYASSTTESTDEDEDTTPLMEKLAIDLYAILANENAKEEDKKSDLDATTVSSEDELTTIEADTEKPTTTTTEKVTTTTRTTTTTTTTEAPTTTTTTEAPKGRGGLTAGRNRFKFQSKAPTSTEGSASEASTESSKPKNRFSRPSSSFSSRNSGSRATKASASTNAPEAVKETVEKSEAPTQTSSRLGSKARNRFSLRTSVAPTTTEKSNDVDSTTQSRLLKPRPQFSLRNRGRNDQTTAAPAESNDVTDEKAAEEEKPAESASIIPKPTSRLNLSRPSSRLLPGQKARTSPLSSRRPANTDETNDTNKSTNENESETTTESNLNKLKSRPRVNVNTDSKAKKSTTSPVAINRKVNPLISKRKFGVTSTTEAAVEDEKPADSESNNSAKEGTNESEVAEVKEEETTQAAEVTSSEQPRGLGLLNRRKLVNRKPGTIN